MRYQIIFVISYTENLKIIFHRDNLHYYIFYWLEWRRNRTYNLR